MSIGREKGFLAVCLPGSSDTVSKVKFLRTDRQVAWTEVTRPEATIKFMTFLPALEHKLNPQKQPSIIDEYF